MATALGGAKIGLSISALLRNLLDGRTVEDSISYNPTLVFVDGTGANQATKSFLDTRTLAASANESLDLAGGLTDAFGNALTFTKIRALMIRAAAGNTNNVLVGGAASNGFVTPFSDATDVAVVRPGGLLLLAAPDATGYAVTAGTGDLLKVANGGGSSAVTYDIFLLGTT